MKVAIFFGSKSDTEIMRGAAKCLKEFGIEYKAFILSAHLPLIFYFTIKYNIIFTVILQNKFLKSKNKFYYPL